MAFSTPQIWFYVAPPQSFQWLPVSRRRKTKLLLWLMKLSLSNSSCLGHSFSLNPRFLSLPISLLFQSLSTSLPLSLFCFLIFLYVLISALIPLLFPLCLHSFILFFLLPPHCLSLFFPLSLSPYLSISSPLSYLPHNFSSQNMSR